MASLPRERGELHDILPPLTREARPALLTIGGKARKLILGNGDNVRNERGLHFLSLPLKPDEEAALERTYGK